MKKMVHVWAILLSLVMGSPTAFSVEATLLQGEWYGEDGSLIIKDCQKGECFVRLSIVNTRAGCDLLDEKIRLINSHEAEFIKNGKAVIGITFNPHGPSVAIEEKDGLFEFRSEYCGVGGSFEGRLWKKGYPQQYETSFDCAKAKGSVEKTLCTTQILALGDRQMHELYQQLLKNPRIAKEKLRINQKVWLSKRDQCSTQSNMAACLKRFYLERILSLQETLVQVLDNPEKETPEALIHFHFLKEYQGDLWIEDYPFLLALETFLPSAAYNPWAGDFLYGNDLIRTTDDELGIIVSDPAFQRDFGCVAVERGGSIWVAMIDDHTTMAPTERKKITIYKPKDSDNGMPEYLKAWLAGFVEKEVNVDIQTQQTFPSTWE